MNRSYITICILALISFAMVQGTGLTFRASNENRELLRPAKKPNIILILADDMGYSDPGCFGSEIQTPNLDALAKGGLRMTQFYNASRCCPTRASLLTGLYQHQAGVGDMVNERTEPAYQGFLNGNCITIAEALGSGGYNTLMTGKWHVGTAPENWPRKRGFHRYFGLIDGASSYFSTTPYRPAQHLTIALDDHAITPEANFYATNSYTDYALKFMDENNVNGQPFFLYLAYTAPHWPLHALPEDIEHYKNTYQPGWDSLRERRFEKMKQSGIIEKDTRLSPRDEAVAPWPTTSVAEKLNWIDKMSVYAAMVHRLDQNIGRILNRLKETGQDKNTLILFLSDNGGSNERISGTGFTPEVLAAAKKPASEQGSFTAYETAGANLSNTPFRMFKKYEFEGGNSTPFIANFPGVIRPGVIDHRPAHIIDIMATCLELAGISYPATYKGNPITPTEGISLLPLFKGKNWKQHEALFFEHEGNRAVRQGDWKLVSQYPANNWHLYNIKKDRTELNDQANSQPEKVAEMISMYNNWAKKVGVIPFGELNKKAAAAE